MRVHPIHVIITGLLICSIGFNILQWNSNNRLVYQIQKLEAGPARGLFLQQEEKQKPQLTDEQLNELIKEMLKKMLRERVV
jgi:predicted Zn-dependent peptidase